MIYTMILCCLCCEAKIVSSSPDKKEQEVTGENPKNEKESSTTPKKNSVNEDQDGVISESYTPDGEECSEEMGDQAEYEEDIGILS